MHHTPLPALHPQRALLHNEIHARPPEALAAPMAITHVVMWADAAQREASRAHLAALLRDHHLPLPGEHNTHLRVDLGAFRLRWELHTEFVSWTFMAPLAADGFAGGGWIFPARAGEGAGRSAGGGTGAPTGAGAGGNVTVDISGAKTRVEAYDAIANTLQQQGLQIGTAEFDAGMKQAWQDNNIAALPEK